MKVENETIESAKEMVTEVANDYCNNHFIGDETDILYIRDEMDGFLKLIAKIEKAKSTREIKKLLMKNYSISKVYSESKINDSLLV